MTETVIFFGSVAGFGVIIVLLIAWAALDVSPARKHRDRDFNG